MNRQLKLARLLKRASRAPDKFSADEREALAKAAVRLLEVGDSMTSIMAASAIVTMVGQEKEAERAGVPPPWRIPVQ